MNRMDTCGNNTSHLFVLSFTVGAESGIALVAANSSSQAFQILKNSGSRNCHDGSHYTLIDNRDIGMIAECNYGLLMESYVNALEAYAAILSVVNRLKGVKGDRGDRGNGIERVEETQVSHEDEGINVVTFYDNDGNNYDIQVRNGRRGRVGVDSVEVNIDDTIGTPSCDVSFVDGVLHLSFSGVKGEQGEVGPPVRVIDSLTIGGVDSALSAERGKEIKIYLDRLDSSFSDTVFIGNAIETGIDISGFPGIDD